MDIEKIFKEWLTSAKDPEVSSELKALKNDPEKLSDAFFTQLLFGTGGLRGKLGAGTNRMNIYTVGRATFGLADYVLDSGKEKSVAIAYDSRNMSKEFALLSAEIMSSKGIKAYLFDRLMPTPVLSYAVRKLKTGAGIVVTASHNPKEYNGYKVYNEKGCQITSEAADAITASIEKYGYFNDFTPDNSLIEYVGEELLDEFIDDVMKNRLPVDKKYIPKIVYTPLNGTGRLPVKKLFAKMGIENYVIVPEQEYPDGNFTTCPFPNPEEKAALSLAVDLAKKVGAKLVIATDPDADRMGIAVVREDGSARLFNGNETGALMENFILSYKAAENSLPNNPYIVKTIVTTPLAEDIAASFGVGVKNVLTGFKYIGEAIDTYKNENYVFGMEESYGYLVGTHARDKDAVSAVMTLAETVCYYAAQGLSLEDALESLYEKYGYYKSGLYSKYFEGKSGMEYMENYMDGLRNAPPKEIGGYAVKNFVDYGKGVDNLPKSNVIKMEGENFSVIVRPSGTEPKIKFYICVKDENARRAEELCKVFEDAVKASV